MSSVANISAYKFVSLDGLPELREALLARAREDGLKGTILLAEEGINLFLAGASAGIESFLGVLREDARFADLEPKYSYSDAVPFRKLLVKIKREIIRMNHPAIRPEAGRAPAVDARTVARWLAQGADDAGRPVVMLDTRNAFEVDEGTFRNAIDWRIERFTQFRTRCRRTATSCGQDRGQLLHRRYPLREGRHLHERGGYRSRLPARGRHSQVFRGNRRAGLRGQVLRVRRARVAGSGAGAQPGLSRRAPGAIRKTRLEAGFVARPAWRQRTRMPGLAPGKGSST